MLDYSKLERNTKAVRITAELLHVKQLLLKAQNGHWLRSTCDSLNEKVRLYSLSGTLERHVFLFIMEQCKSMEKERRFVQAWSSVRVWKKKDVSFKLGAV